MLARLIAAVIKRLLIVVVPLSLIAVVSWNYAAKHSGVWAVVVCVIALLCGFGALALFVVVLKGAHEDWSRWQNAVRENPFLERLRQGGPYGRMLAGDITPEEYLASFDTPETEEGHERDNGSAEGPGIRTAQTPRKNIGGWLALFCIGQFILAPLLNVSQAISSMSSADRVFDIALAVYQVFVGFIVIRRSPRVFGNLKAYFIVTGCVGLFNLPYFYDVGTVNSILPWRVIRVLAPLYLWISYFQRSKRVAETFGRNLGINWRDRRVKPYTDAGVALTYKLISSLHLTGWNRGLPVFTQIEAEAIQSSLDSLQRMANAEHGGEVVFHPDAAEKIQRQFGAEALKRLAGDEWKFSDGLPSTWREIASTYLKAWAMNLDPMVLIELSELLALASHKAEAKEAAEIVANSFPDYAPRFFAGADVGNKVTNQVVASAREAIQRL